MLSCLKNLERFSSAQIFSKRVLLKKKIYAFKKTATVNDPTAVVISPSVPLKKYKERKKICIESISELGNKGPQLPGRSSAVDTSKAQVKKKRSPVFNLLICEQAHREDQQESAFAALDAPRKSQRKADYKYDEYLI